jgi:hypothetical protein
MKVAPSNATSASPPQLGAGSSWQTSRSHNQCHDHNRAAATTEKSCLRVERPSNSIAGGRCRELVVVVIICKVCEKMRRGGGSVFPAHVNTGDPNEADPLMRS